MNKEIIYFVDKFNILSFLKLIFKKKSSNINEIYYLTSSKLIVKVCKLFFAEKIILKKFLLNKRTFPFEKILKKIEASDSFKSNELSFNDALKTLQDVNNNRFDSKKLLLYFEKELADLLLNAVGILETLSINNEFGDQNTEYVVLLERSFLIDKLRELYKHIPNLRIETYLCLNNLFMVFYGTIKHWLILIYNFVLLFFAKKISEKNKNSKIAVLFAHGVDLNKKSDLFWLPDSGINPKDIILYSLYHNRLWNEESLSIIKELGVDYVNLLSFKISFKPFSSKAIYLFRFPYLSFIKRIIEVIFINIKLFLKLFVAKDFASYLWYWSRFLILLEDVSFFECFFKEYNIKIHFSAFEGGRHLSAANIAIKLVRGIDVAHHWSNYDIFDIVVAKPHDVYFTWGEYYRKNIFLEEFYQVNTYIYTGYPYDNLLASCKELSKQYRSLLESKGAKFIICFFDQELTPNESLWNKGILEIYNYLLNLIITNKDVGIVIKPKKTQGIEGLINKLPYLKSIIIKAVDTNRLLVLDTNKMPAEAAGCSDLAIGFGSNSTPCFESALIGCRAITYDPEKSVEYHMYKHGLNKIMFNEIEELIKSVDFFMSLNEPTLIGDYSYIINEFDPFLDGKAYKRVGFYIKNVLDSFNYNKNTNDVIKLANEEYGKKFGFDKLFSINKKEEKIMEGFYG